MTKVFVYGTLRLGWGGHMSKFLETNATHVGPGVLKADLYEAGVPAVFNTDTPNEVIGDLFEFNSDEVLETLDHYEGHPSFYERRLTEVTVDGKKHEAFVYWMNGDPKHSTSWRRVDSGNFFTTRWSE